MKKILAFLLTLATPVLAQVQIPAQIDRPIFSGFSLTQTSTTYCAISLLQPGSGRIQTSGSSTTVTAAVGTPFQGLVVGDELNPQGPGLVGYQTTAVGGNPFTRYITAVGSATSVTVNSAVNLSTSPTANGFAFQFRTYGDGAGNSLCGTTVNQGWVSIPSGKYVVTIVVPSVAGVATLTYSVEGLPRGGGPFEGPVQLINGTITSFSAPVTGGPQAQAIIPIGENYGYIRVGMNVNAGTASGVSVILSAYR